MTPADSALLIELARKLHETLADAEDPERYSTALAFVRRIGEMLRDELGRTALQTCLASAEASLRIAVSEPHDAATDALINAMQDVIAAVKELA